MRNFIIFLSLLLCLNINSLDYQLKIFTEESKPANFTKDGVLTGSSVEIVREILRRLNKNFPIEVVPWARGYKMLQEEPNVVLFSTTRTEERENLFYWVGPIVQVKWLLVKKKGNNKIKIEKLEDAKNPDLIIGTYKDDAREQFLKKEGFTNLESINDQVANAKKLVSGRIDLWVTANLGMAETLKSASLKLDDVEVAYVIKKADLYIAFSKQTDINIVNEWQKTFEEMKKDKTFIKIYQKWYPGETIQ